MKSVFKLATLTAAFVGYAILAAATVHAATIGYRGANGGYSALTIDGEIIPGDMQRLENAYAALSPAQRKHIMIIELNSPGGNVAESFKIAAFVRSHKLVTQVGIGDGKLKVCASACFFIFAEGVYGGVILPAKIGVHSISVDGAETDAAARVTISVMRKLALSGHVPDAILGKMALASPNEMIWLTVADLHTMNTPVVLAPCKTLEQGEAEYQAGRKFSLRMGLPVVERTGLCVVSN